MRRSRWINIPLVFLMLTGLELVLSAPASANPNCGNEDGIFWTMSSGGSFVGGSYGASGLHTLEDRGLANGCPAYYLSVSTAHIDETLDQMDWVEAGWVETKVCDDCPHLFFQFIEAGINGNTIDHTPAEDVFPCSFPVGSTATIYVTNFGTNDWNGRMNCNDGSGDHLLGTMNDTGHNTGYAAVEDSRYGGVGSGMADLVLNLKHRNSAGNWNLFPSFKCLSDYATSGTNNWNGEHHGSNDDYDTVMAANSCPKPG